MIQTNGLTRKFGNFVAVHDLNLHVPKGVIFGFLGPNGSGKSTTVKMLTGILKPSAGDALIDDLSIRTAPLEIKRRKLALTTFFALLALRTFTHTLHSQPRRRSQRIFSLTQLPGKFGGLIKKDLRYSTRMLDLYLVLPLVILFNMYWRQPPLHPPALSQYSSVLFFCRASVSPSTVWVSIARSPSTATRSSRSAAKRNSSARTWRLPC